MLGRIIEITEPKCLMSSSTFNHSSAWQDVELSTILFLRPYSRGFYSELVKPDEQA